MIPFLVITNIILIFTAAALLFRRLLKAIRNIVQSGEVIETVLALKMFKSLALVLVVCSFRFIFIHRENILDFVAENYLMVIYADIGIVVITTLIGLFFLRKYFEIFR